ncbi:hypothetical protein NL676_000467 [Syzygium grande]|nr:hypothetical protein NL676_000467 [Syzygium grande]
MKGRTNSSTPPIEFNDREREREAGNGGGGSGGRPFGLRGGADQCTDGSSGGLEGGDGDLAAENQGGY